MNTKNIGVSILEKLRNVSRETGVNMQAILRRYAQERLLYRLSVSPEAENFCVKGGVLMSAYNAGNLLRPTEDIDFNGFDKTGDIGLVAKMLYRILATEDLSDGITFDMKSMKIEKDRDGTIPGGKISLLAYVHTARVEVRVDVGFGNVLTPGVKLITMPTILSSVAPQPQVLAYPLETVISEKTHAIFTYHIYNTRLKDFFDLFFILKNNEFSGQMICDAIVNTFDAHGDMIPAAPMPGLSEEFAEDKRAAYAAFLKKIGASQSMDFGALVEEVRGFIQPAVTAAATDKVFAFDWRPDNGWSDQRLVAVPK